MILELALWGLLIIEILISNITCILFSFHEINTVYNLVIFFLFMALVHIELSLYLNDKTSMPRLFIFFLTLCSMAYYILTINTEYLLLNIFFIILIILVTGIGKTISYKRAINFKRKTLLQRL
jgi:hypothetical protein